MFQELPQLLDAHLQKWVTLLATSYLEYLLNGHASRASSKAKPEQVVPMDHVICRILYTLCKVRGEKIIVRFLNVEAKYLEPLLSAVEEADGNGSVKRKWSWEQRYVIVLWLSHLLLAPFDLATISSAEFEEQKVPDIPNLILQDDLPGITKRVIPLGIEYLASPGKERDAAKALLVRMAMRRDMQQLRVLRSLVNWALASLRETDSGKQHSTYFYLGVLSFLAGALRSSSETSDMTEFLEPIFNTAHALTLQETPLAKTISSFAVARKMTLKVIQSVVVICLRQPQQTMEQTVMTETAIGVLLESVADNDTPVRMAASKCLSVITLKLDPDMASQVVEAVLDSLNRNVLWDKTGARPVRDLAAVNHLEWHGLMLTLSHLLYRRSPPASQLSDIVHALLLGLSFDQRSTSGASVGSNVRDASCFGIWALARRYTTAELLAVPLQSVFAAKAHPSTGSILQVLATELVMSASLDPFGNIRRGASAALQELIGRHPDTVTKGISVVQTVDYHAVARRTRAIGEVAVNASRLANEYGEAALDSILGWRGVGDAETQSRRDSGLAYGIITVELSRYGDESPALCLKKSFGAAQQTLSRLAKRQVEERHGLLLCMASLFDQLPALGISGEEHGQLLSAMLDSVVAILRDCKETTYRRPELIIEAASKLTVAAWPAIAALIVLSPAACTGQDVFSPKGTRNCWKVVEELRGSANFSRVADKFVLALSELLPAWLEASDTDTTETISLAALLLTTLLDEQSRANQLAQWAEIVRFKSATRSPSKGHAYFFVLCLSRAHQDILLLRWQDDNHIDTRIAILQALTFSGALKSSPESYLDTLVDALGDYTTTGQGDIGSQLRVQALKAVHMLWKHMEDLRTESWLMPSIAKLILPILRLSAEKLDRVRAEAQTAVALLLKSDSQARFMASSFSSAAYFSALLGLTSSTSLHDCVNAFLIDNRTAWIAHLMAGYVSSADTGNEELVIRSRDALTAFCCQSKVNNEEICAAMLSNLKDYQDEDRVLVPTLELVAFLFNVDLFQQCSDFKYKSLCLQTQKAAYKTGNIRKLLAAVKVYGAIAGNIDADPGAVEARKRLAALMGHPWPKVRTGVIDELWTISLGSKALTSVDWGRADKAAISELVEELQL